MNSTKRLLLIALIGCAPNQDGAGEEEELRASRSVLDILRGLPKETEWSDAGRSVQNALKNRARRRLAEYHALHGGRALRSNEAALESHPTPAMSAAFDAWVAGRFQGAATSSIANGDLLTVLRKLYVVNVAQSRVSASVYHNAPNTEIDGVTPYSGISLPDEDTYAEQEAYAREALALREQIDVASLSASDAAVHERAGHFLRSAATGSFGSFGLGGEDLFNPGGVLAWTYDIMYHKGPDGGAIFPDDDAFLDDANAFFFGPTYELNVGTMQMARGFGWASTGVDDVLELWVGNPDTDDTARSFYLLSHWYVQRLEAQRNADRRCTVYSNADRTRIWESFTADNLFHDPTTSLAWYRTVVEQQGATFTAAGKASAEAALEAVFPVGSVLTEAQRAQVIDRVRDEGKLGSLAQTITAALDETTGSTLASSQFQAALDSLPAVGGYGDPAAPVTAADEALIAAMWNEVRTWLAATYAGGPVDIGAALPATITAANSSGSFTGLTGEISIGIRARRPLAHVYSTMIHEAHHAVNHRSGFFAEGPAWEGAALLAERMTVAAFLSTVFGNDPLRLSLSTFDLARVDARLIGITMARLEIYLRNTCRRSQPDSNELAREVLAEWGLTENVDVFVERAHNAGQYLKYLFGQSLYADVVDYFEDQINPAQDDGIDPYDLLRCGLPNATKTPADVTALRTCLGI